MPISLNSTLGTTDTTGAQPPQPPQGAPTGLTLGGTAPIATAPAPSDTTAPPKSPGMSIASTLKTPDTSIPQLNAPPVRLEDIVKDMAEGAAAPFTGAWHAGLGLLADPAFRVLPLETQQKNLDEAERLGWKGAAFWGSMFVGGPVAKLPVALLWKLGISGGLAGGTFAALENAPSLIHGYEDPKTYANDVATTATFGALTGGALALVPGAAQIAGRTAGGTARLAARAMNKAIDLTPGGAAVRAKTQQFVGEAFAKSWHYIGTSGEVILNKAGLPNLVTQMKAARSAAALKAGELVAGMYKNFQGLSDEELQRVTFFIEHFDFSDPELYGVAAEYTTNKADERLFGIAQREANRMIELGQFMQKAGMQVYDPEDNSFHRFALRKNYIPHRFVNPEFYREGGEHRDETIRLLMQKTGRTVDQAKEWVDAFANRIDNWNQGVVEGRFPVGTSGHYLIGRSLGLPGYETRLDRILPQYYEHVARRLTNHIFFGADPIETAVEQGVKTDMLAHGQLPPEAAVVQPADLTYTPPNPRQPSSMWEIIYARQRRAESEARAAQAIEFKYPKAFAPLETLPDGEMKKLATSVVRGQFGILDQPQFGKKPLEWLAKTEVVTKLALGAISQPSQMLSGIVRTRYRGAVRDLFRLMSQDPEVHDFAIRSSVALRSVVRDAQHALTSKETDFLDKVLFTQFDVSSRVYGALRGASEAEYMAKELVATVQKAQTIGRNPFARVAGTPKILQKRIAMLEKKFADLGIDAQEVVAHGGTLENEQILKAAQTVSMDVNFWGDALSLPVFYRSPYGRFITQFKSFGFQQSRLVKDQVVKPFVQWVEGKGGDPMPMTRFALLMPLGGEAISDLKAVARAKERPTNAVERIAENMGNAAGWGLLYDATRATDFGVAGTLGLAVGPIGSDFGKLGAALGEAKRGRGTKLARFALEEGLPMGAYYLTPRLAPAAAAITPALSNLLLPKREGNQ